MCFGDGICFDIRLDAGQIGLRQIHAATQPLKKSGVRSDIVADSGEAHTPLCRVPLYARKSVMIPHAADSANRHVKSQVPIDPLPFGTEIGVYSCMERRFRPALMWHMEQDGTTIAALARGSGVSEDVIKKLRSGSSQSTDAEKAMAIAAYYGKTLEAFIRCGSQVEDDMFAALVRRLSDQERGILRAQIEGILASRDGKAG